jgi:N-acetylglutamate synthase-like GNAT family acetyltransferase
MTVEIIDEFRLDRETKQQIAELVKVCFPESEYNGRTYYKQLPHYRLLLREEKKIVGQLGLDYRVMTLNGKPINVLGVVDLTILPSYQGKGLGTKLLKELDNIIEPEKQNIDFLFLVADKHEFYERSGYTLTKQKVKWLTIEEHINYGPQEKEFDDCLMYKQVGKIEWTENGELDMFGYWY